MIEKLKSLLKNKKILCVVLGIVLVIIATVTILITINCKDSKNKASSGELFSTEKLTTKQEKTTKKEETTKAPPETTTETQSSETTTETTTATETKGTTEPTTKKNMEGNSTGGSQEVRDDGEVSPGGTGGETGKQGVTGDQGKTGDRGKTGDQGETVIKERKEDTQKRDELFKDLLFDKAKVYTISPKYFEDLSDVLRKYSANKITISKALTDMENCEGTYNDSKMHLVNRKIYIEQIDISGKNYMEIRKMVAEKAFPQYINYYENFVPNYNYIDLYVYHEINGQTIMYLGYCNSIASKQ